MEHKMFIFVVKFIICIYINITFNYIYYKNNKAEVYSKIEFNKSSILNFMHNAYKY